MKISATMNEALWSEVDFDFYAAKQNCSRKSIKEKKIYIGQWNLALNTWSTLAQLVNRRQQLPLLLARPTTWDYLAWRFLGCVSWRPQNTTNTALVVFNLDNQIVAFLFCSENGDGQ